MTDDLSAIAADAKARIAAAEATIPDARLIGHVADGDGALRLG